MNENYIHEKAERIRDVIRYIRKFKNALVIIYIDNSLIDSPLFTSHIRDICFIHEAGLKVIMVPGASKRINEVLSSAGITWNIHNNCRITGSEAMPLIKMAAFDVSNQVMTAFAGEKQTAVIGNWVRARGKGVIEGFDYGTSGEIDRLEIESIRTVLDNGFIPIFPCIGWSAVGKPYNISSIELAQQIAVHMKAEKLFFLIPNADISQQMFTIPQDLGLSPEGTVPAMNLEEVDNFLKNNDQSVNSEAKTTDQTINSSEFNYRSVVLKEKILSLLALAKKACSNGVSRVHILNGSFDGTISCEIFSDLGSGTMIYSQNYGRIRDMIREDIPSVLSVMQPFVDNGVLLPRSKEILLNQLSDYIVYELDGAIRACAALLPYSDGQMEIAGVAVEKTCSHIGIGPKMIMFLVERAKKLHAKSIFLLTTQTADWFEKLGFVASEVSTLPEKRKELWTPQRGSKVMRINI